PVLRFARRRAHSGRALERALRRAQRLLRRVAPPERVFAVEDDRTVAGEREVPVEAHRTVFGLEQRLARAQVQCPEGVSGAGFEVAPPDLALAIYQRRRGTALSGEARENGRLAALGVEAVELPARKPLRPLVRGLTRAVAVVERAAEQNAAVGCL